MLPLPGRVTPAPSSPEPVTLPTGPTSPIRPIPHLHRASRPVPGRSGSTPTAQALPGTAAPPSPSASPSPDLAAPPPDARYLLPSPTRARTSAPLRPNPLAWPPPPPIMNFHDRTTTHHRRGPRRQWDRLPAGLLCWIRLPTSLFRPRSRLLQASDPPRPGRRRSANLRAPLRVSHPSRPFRAHFVSSSFRRFVASPQPSPLGGEGRIDASRSG